MARRSSARSRKKGVTVDFSEVGKQFEAGMEYPLEVKECKLEEGNEYPYFAFQFKGLDEDYENSIMYHNASTSPQSLWRLRPLLEAFGMDIPEGPMDIDPAELVGMQCMASTISEKKPGGGTSIRPDEFWALEGGDEKEDNKTDKKTTSGKTTGKKAEPKVDLDSLSDDAIKALAEEFGIKGRVVKKLRAELATADEEDLAAAINDLNLAGDEDEKISEEEIQGMNEEELEEIIEKFDLDDVDLSEHRTLRKKKAAVIDALQEAGAIE